VGLLDEPLAAFQKRLVLKESEDLEPRIQQMIRGICGSDFLVRY